MYVDVIVTKRKSIVLYKYINGTLDCSLNADKGWEIYYTVTKK